MLTPARAKSIGEPEKVRLIESVQHFDQGALDNLIFQQRYAERTPLSRLIRLADVGPSDRLRSVRSSFKSIG